MSHTAALGLLAALLTTLTPAARAGGVAIVDAPGLGVLPDLQVAVDAAVSGDVLLVASGVYAPFTIDGKALSIFAMPGGAVTINGTVEVRNLQASQRVILSGLSVAALPASVITQPPPGLRLESNAGQVRVQHCTFVGGEGMQGSCYSNGAGGHGVQALNSARVAIVASTLRGGRGYHNTTAPFDCIGGDGGHGLNASGSAVALYHCDVRGGDGGQYGFEGGTGGYGARQADFGLFATGSTFQGGAGGYAADIGSEGGDGGDGLRVDPGAQAKLADNEYTGGPRGEALPGPQNAGDDGLPFSGGGVYVFHPVASRRLSAPAIVSESAALAIVAQGEPGDSVFAIDASNAAWVLSAKFAGPWLVPVPTFLARSDAVRIGASGSATLVRTMPDVVSAPAGRVRWIQGAVVGPAGNLLATPLHVLVLDRAGQPDCDGNGLLDWLDLLEGVSADCDGDLASDACELVLGAADCNNNARQDSCDIASGASQDVNSNGVPDECESLGLTLYVDDSAAPGGDGSAAAPFQTMAEALAISLSGDTIVIQDGLYVGAGNKELSLGGRELRIKSQNGPANCVFDAGGSGALFKLEDGEGPDTRLEGLTLMRASPALWVSGLGGPLGPNVTVVDCRFTACGGLRGAYIGRGEARFERCLFDANLGGAVWLGEVYSTPRAHFVDCSFVGNSHVSVGGAVLASHGNAGIVFERCDFLGNTAKSGGAIYTGFYGVTPVISNCCFAGNTAQRGGAIYLLGGGPNIPPSLAISNTTFADNTASIEGGALFVGQFTSCTLRNSILWGNASPLGAQLRVHGSNALATCVVARCDVQGGQAAVSVGNGVLNWGAGNLALDPLFADPDGPDNLPATYLDNDYSLQLGSPCLDAGDNALVALDLLDLDGDLNTLEPAPFDFAGNARFVDVPSAPDVGVGAPPLVDIGAFERF